MINISWHRKGSVLMGAVLCLIVIGLIVPALIMRIQKESRDVVGQKKRTTAFHLAEAGQDRGAWKLRESSQMWLDASTGTVITGYNDDVEYADIEGGVYKISFSSGPNLDEVTVISKGKADNSDVVRAVQAVYSKTGDTPIPALSVNGALTWKAGLDVHWGPVISYGAINDPMPYYPRKYAAGQIEERDTADDANNGALPGDNWSTYDYVAFYDLGVPPDIPIDNYRVRAKALTGIPAMKNATQNPAGSGYFTPTAVGGLDIDIPSGSGGYDFHCSTCVLFIEGDVKKFPNGSELEVEALIVTGDMDYNSDDLTITANIPCSASQEYLHSSLGTYFTDQSWADCGTASISGVGMYGFLYVGEDMENAGGGATLIGALYLVGDLKVNTFKIYYDADVAASIETGGSGQMYRDSWDEVSVSW